MRKTVVFLMIVSLALGITLENFIKYLFKTGLAERTRFEVAGKKMTIEAEADTILTLLTQKEVQLPPYKLMRGKKNWLLILDFSASKPAAAASSAAEKEKKQKKSSPQSLRKENRPAKPAVRKITLTRNLTPVSSPAPSPAAVRTSSSLRTSKPSSLPAAKKRSLSARKPAASSSSSSAVSRTSSKKPALRSSTKPAPASKKTNSKVQLAAALKKKDPAQKRRRFTSERERKLYELAGEKLFKKVTFSFTQLDAITFFKALSDALSVNVVLLEAPSRPITLFLKGTTWKEALDLVCDFLGLVYYFSGNNMIVATPATIKKQRELKKQLYDALLEGDVVEETLEFNYLSAKEAASVLSQFLPPASFTLVGNKAIIKAPASAVEKLKKVLSELDRPPVQIEISAMMVEVSTDAVRSLGINWGYNINLDPAHNSNLPLYFPYQINGKGTVPPITQNTLPGEFTAFRARSDSVLSAGFQFGSVFDVFKFSMRLHGLIKEGKARIISKPHVVTTPLKEAEIVQGQRIPLQTYQQFTITSQYVNAALTLKVTPHVTRDNIVLMDLEIRNDNADFSYRVNQNPVINTQALKTTVAVPDRTLLVIGGLKRKRRHTTKYGVPVLVRIPIIGSLFSHREKEITESELLIFIRPAIRRIFTPERKSTGG